MYADSIEEAEKELYVALEALESGNLTFARSSTARAQSAIVEAWRLRQQEVANEQTRAVLE
jgi:cellobiose-specific phosphotransferase system component IIA